MTQWSSKFPFCLPNLLVGAVHLAAWDLHALRSVNAQSDRMHGPKEGISITSQTLAANLRPEEDLLKEDSSIRIGSSDHNVPYLKANMW